MSKRKRSTSKETPPATPSEGTEGAPTVHVSSDMLAGSPDIWAPGKDKPIEESSDVAAEEAKPATEAEPVTEEPLSMSEDAPASEEQAEAAATETDATASAVSAPPPPTYQPRPPAYVAPGPTPGRTGSSIAFGVVLVVLGLFALVVQFTGFDAGESWPLFVIIPGLTLLGLILAYQSSSGDWPSWAFAWPLVAPGGVGLGLYLQGVRNHDPHVLRQGRVLMFVAAIIFMIAFVIFGTVLNIGGYNYGWFGKAALPALLIVVGLVLLARSIQRTRNA